MNKEEILNIIAKIDEQLEENNKIYRMYEGSSKDKLGPTLWECIIRIGDVSIALMEAKHELCIELREKYGVFIM